MIDTIILEIPIEYGVITNHNRFNPTTKDLFDNTSNFTKYINNPTKEEKDTGIYRPRLTILKRQKRLFLKVEFSAPKMLFGNNLDEVEENDFNSLVKALQQAIKEMGVLLWAWQIEEAEITSFHVSKNIILSKGYTASFVIKELSKVNLNQKMDLEKTSFRNEGEALQFYANRHSFVFYDKMSDITKPTKRAIDKDQVKPQLNLFEKKQEKMEILKMEVRLSHKSKMKEVLEEIGFNDSLLFKNIFKKEICQKILALYWNNFFKNNRFLFAVNNSPQEILQLILKKYPKTHIKTAIMLVGLNLLCKDDSMRAFKNIAKNYRPKSNWLKLTNYLKKFENDIFFQPQHGYIKDIEEAISHLKPIRLERFGRLSPPCPVKNCKV